MKRLGVFLFPLDGMLVHCRSLPSDLLSFPQQFAGTHLYSWVERGTVRVKCLAQEHDTMSPARAWTQTARSCDERTNHEATAPPLDNRELKITTTATATGTSLNKRFNEQNNSCARALSFLVHFSAVLCKTATWNDPILRRLKNVSHDG